MSRRLKRFAIWMPLACCVAIHATAEVTVDWNSPRGTATSPCYGTNIFSAFEPAVSDKPSYVHAKKLLEVAVLIEPPSVCAIISFFNFHRYSISHPKNCIS
jgi:hypothetical protein